MTATANPTGDDLIPSERAILAAAGRVAAALGQPPAPTAISRQCRYCRSYVRRTMYDLDARGLWPWPLPYTRAAVPRYRPDETTLKARVAATRRGDDPDDPEPAPPPVPPPAWFIGSGRRPDRIDDHWMLRDSRNYRRLVRLLRRPREEDAR